MVVTKEPRETSVNYGCLKYQNPATLWLPEESPRHIARKPQGWWWAGLSPFVSVGRKIQPHSPGICGFQYLSVWSLRLFWWQESQSGGRTGHTAVLLLALPCLIIRTTSETRFLMLGTDLKYLCFSFFLAIFSSSESLPKSSLVSWEPRGGGGLGFWSKKERDLLLAGVGRGLLDCSFVCPSWPR